ncbi:hypothetical protein SAMN05421644_10174 [Allochromatium warmingii]|uniref:DUF2288 domain-containing protein n=1 Tax=Allochromatium warmingii TaxID=61595 RepID=A0A1H3AQ71_ALLWA|nr:DUF2288 domain-containing protein [Allochromatium warmingii]SDX31900.1 hypothetical protein SAMN05421644_10174 [Allochromatium warmingii]
MSAIRPLDDPETLERARINQETARLPWRELQRLFAQGRVIAVAPELDLVELALRCARDDAPTIAANLEQGRLAPVSDAQARAWLAADAEVWAVVVKPWVLVQQMCPTSSVE